MQSFPETTYMTAAILTKKETAFVLWKAASTAMPPALVIGQLQEGTPITLVNEKVLPLQPDPAFPDLWSVNASDCNLQEGTVYHYWFEVNDARSGHGAQRIRITDPVACMVDWRLLARRPAGAAFTDDDRFPAAVILFKNGRLLCCDAGGEQYVLDSDNSLEHLPANNRLVIYELPTAWTHDSTVGEREVGVGSFCDVTALIDPDAAALNFTELDIVQKGRQYLVELGINAIELLPPADSYYNREWGYGTTNFFAPDADLGTGPNYSWPAPNRDLQALVRAAHTYGIRFFVDAVTGFARTNAYEAAGPDDFFIFDPQQHGNDPDAHDSRGGFRNGWGSSLFRYAHFVNGYDPLSGQTAPICPARQYMKASLVHWINHFHIDGVRMDSIETVANWDFVQEYKDTGWQAWRGRFSGLATADAINQRFLVVGEELTEPLALLHQQRLDGIWHENFKRYVRCALLGEVAGGTGSFEETVQKMIDCRQFGFTDLSQAVIYLTSHDVEGYRNERLYNFLNNNGVADTEKRIKLGFVCLLTAVGIPMILAGEEFADQHDLFDAKGNVDQAGGKQVDPVNFSRAEDDWRKRIRECVSRLTALRASNPALAVNETSFLHADFAGGKRVMAWMRGDPASGNIVIVVANFSDFGTENPALPGAEYIVPNWPITPTGKTWREVTKDRPVPPDWVGREPLYPWEAKVYALV